MNMGRRTDVSELEVEECGEREESAASTEGGQRNFLTFWIFKIWAKS